MKLSDIQIVKKRPLATADLDSEYPKLMPFYCYGTLANAHIDHALLLAPNIQLSANVTLNLKSALSDNVLDQGVIVVASQVREYTMHPFPEVSSPDVTDTFFFAPQNTFAVEVYSDPYPATSTEPIDLIKIKGHLLTSGTMTLAGGVYVDSRRLNSDEEFPRAQQFLFASSIKMTRHEKQKHIDAFKKFHGQLVNLQDHENRVIDA